MNNYIDEIKSLEENKTSVEPQEPAGFNKEKIILESSGVPPQRTEESPKEEQADEKSLTSKGEETLGIIVRKYRLKK